VLAWAVALTVLGGILLAVRHRAARI